MTYGKILTQWKSNSQSNCSWDFFLLTLFEKEKKRQAFHLTDFIWRMMKRFWKHLFFLPVSFLNLVFLSQMNFYDSGLTQKSFVSIELPKPAHCMPGCCHIEVELSVQNKKIIIQSKDLWTQPKINSILHFYSSLQCVGDAPQCTRCKSKPDKFERSISGKFPDTRCNQSCLEKLGLKPYNTNLRNYDNELRGICVENACHCYSAVQGKIFSSNKDIFSQDKTKWLAAGQSLWP